TRAAASAKEAHAVLDRMPVPFNVRTLLTFLHDASEFRRDERVPAVIPLFDDLRDPLDTIIAWQALTPAQILTEMQTALTDANGFVQTGVESTLGPLFTD